MKLFPTRFNLVLDEEERMAMDTLWDELGSKMVDELELIHRAIAEGIKVLNRVGEAQRTSPDRPPTRTQVEAQKKTEKRARKLAPDSAVVHNYVATPISGDMQRRLESFLVTHPGMGEEDAVRYLLDLALSSTEGEEQTTLERAASRARLMLLRHGYRA